MDRISLLPNEILLNILRHINLISDIRAFANISRRFHQALNVELYLRCGRLHNWLPLFVGAQRGDIRLLEVCFDLGAPLNTIWQGDQMWSHVSIYPFHQPLVTAVEYGQVSAVMWLLSKKVNLNGGANSFDVDITPLKACLQISSMDASSQDTKRSNERELARYQIFRALLARGANVNPGNVEVFSPLREVLRQVHEGLGLGGGIPYLALLLEGKADPSRLCKLRSRPHVCWLDPSTLGSRCERHEEYYCLEDSLNLLPEHINIIVQRMEECETNRDLLLPDQFQKVRQFFFTLRFVAEERQARDQITRVRLLEFRDRLSRILG